MWKIKFTIRMNDSVLFKGCLKALLLGDNDLNRFPPSIEKFVHLEVVGFMLIVCNTLRCFVHACVCSFAVNLQPIIMMVCYVDIACDQGQ